MLNPPAAAHRRKRICVRSGRKWQASGQHRPRGQHAAPEFLEESLALPMVLAGTIQHRDERTRVNENAFRNERPLPYLAHAASRTTHRRYDRSLPERGSPASGRHPSSNRASARRSGNLRNPQRDLSVLLPRRAEPHRGSRGAGGGAQRAKAPRPFLDERSDIEARLTRRGRWVGNSPQRGKGVPFRGRRTDFATVRPTSSARPTPVRAPLGPACPCPGAPAWSSTNLPGSACGPEHLRSRS